MKNQSEDKTQHDRFIETARTLGCDEDEAVFDEKLKVIAAHKPKPSPPPSRKPGKGGNK